MAHERRERILLDQFGVGHGLYASHPHHSVLEQYRIFPPIEPIGELIQPPLGASFRRDYHQQSI